MTVSYKKTGAAGIAYYTDCSKADRSVGVDDYYSGGAKEPPGTWYAGTDADGSRLSAIGIDDGRVFGSVEGMEDAERFSMLGRGWNPEGGPKLVQNAGDENRVALHDFCLSAPKSVSVVWSQADAKTKLDIEKAQEKAARTFLDFLSSKSISRQGKAGILKTAAPLRGALFAHGSSRENDPQLHTHAVMFNVCERADGTTGALETKGMMKWMGAAASLYHADLAWTLNQQGFGIERKGSLFEVAGVPQDVMKAFSKRRAQLVAAVEARQKRQGIDPNASKASRGQFQTAALESRNAKNELTRSELETLWREEGAALGFTQAEADALRNPELQAPELSDDELLEEARLAVKEITETHAVFKEPALLTKVAVRLLGRASPEQILRAVEAVKLKDLMVTQTREAVSVEAPLVAVKTEEVGEKKMSATERLRSKALKSGGETAYAQVKTEESEAVFTTREMYVLEREMLQLADRKDGKHVLEGFELPPTLDREQADATIRATTDTNAVTVIEGTAGAGKTYTMNAIARAYESNGYTVTGLAADWSAASSLKKSAQLAEGKAITGWVLGVNKGRIEINNKSLIVIDEAGKVGAKVMQEVLRISKEAGAKVILLGDTLQQKSVAAGDPLRVIAKQNGSARLDTIRRQKDESEREAVLSFFAGRAAEGLETYQAKGAVKFSTGEEETHKNLIADWNTSRLAHPDQSHLILALDKASTHTLNALAHQARKDAGELGDGLMLRPMGCPKDELVEMSVNDRVVFRTNDNTQGVFSRLEGTIVSIDNTTLYVQTNEKIIEVDTTADQWQSQDKEGGLAIQHAYATTIYSSQGMTVDRVFVKDALGLARDSAGVAMSRHVQGCHVHVDLQVRWEAKMKVAKADDWHPLKEFKEAECLGRMGKAWSSEHKKESSLDFEKWAEAGALVDEKAEVAILGVMEQNNEICVKKISAAAERLRESSGKNGAELPVDPHAQSEGDDYAQSEESEGDVEILTLKITPAAERLREISKTLSAPVNEPLLWQEGPAYELKEPRQIRDAVEAGIGNLQEDAIESAVIAEAGRQGFLRFDEAGKPVFCGRRPDDQKLVLALSDAQQDPVGLRSRFPPILHGDPARLDVVKTGQEALALWSLQDKLEQTRSTIVVSSGKEDALSLPHTRELAEKATTTVRHDLNKELTKESIPEANKAASEAASKEQERKQQERHR